jgi:23S rRNA (cytidine1920-2'-O)/16S rRNA (cytidine1409-2'-O)-methyltransferase
LENGVCNVFAVDIGTAQLHPSIKSDPRIVNMEHTNARYLQASDFPLHIDVATADLSFISIKAVLPAIKAVLGEQGEAIILVKPQFEAGPENLSKSGVVLNLKVHISVLKEVTDFAQNCGFGVAGIAFSGLAGESGNREYLLYLNIGQTIKIDIPTAIKEAVYSEDNHE